MNHNKLRSERERGREREREREREGDYDKENRMPFRNSDNRLMKTQISFTREYVVFETIFCVLVACFKVSSLVLSSTYLWHFTQIQFVHKESR